MGHRIGSLLAERKPLSRHLRGHGRMLPKFMSIIMIYVTMCKTMFVSWYCTADPPKLTPYGVMHIRHKRLSHN
jgi:hypothetical protein